MEGFKIQRVKAKATVFFPNGEPLEGSFFVSPISELHEGEQSIAELLEEGRSYIPFENDEGELLLLPVQAIERITTQKPPAISCQASPHGPSFGEKALVRVTLLSSKTLEGSIPFDMPPSHARISDFLNRGTKFFTMMIKGEPNLINHGHVRSILLL